MKPDCLLHQRMLRTVIVCATAVCFAGEAKSQSPTISATQYVIQVQGFQAADYDNLPNVFYSRQFDLYHQSGTAVANIAGYGSGNFSSEWFVTEEKKPAVLTAKYSVHFDNYHCENYDPGCSGGMEQVRTAGRDSARRKDNAKAVRKGDKNLTAARAATYGDACGSCWWESYNFYSMYIPNIPLRYPISDTTFQYGTNTVTVSVRPAGDQNYNLPSADNISIKADGDVSGYAWEYQVLQPGFSWTPVPGGLVKPGGAEVVLNGQSLLGSGWMAYVNKTVLFRLKNSVNVTSNILIYTHRLSSPRIVNVEAFQNPCFGMDTAFVKIKLDRPLIADEKLNIFLKDTALGLDYSALNLTNASLDPVTNTYTWPRELVQGGYKISLIGKYFDYATYTGSSGHFAFAKITDPELLRFYLSQTPALCYDGNSGKIKIAAKGGTGSYRYELLNDTLPFTTTWTVFANPVYNAGYNAYEVEKGGLVSQLYKVRLRDGNDCLVRDSTGREICKNILVKQPSEPLQLSLLNVSPITAYNLTDGAITARITGGTPLPVPEVPAIPYQKYLFQWRDSVTGSVINNYTLDTAGKFQTSIQNLAEGTYRFTAWDASWAAGSPYNQQGCLIDVYIRLTKPVPLNVTVTAASPVKCFGQQNAELKAVASGGIPVSDSLLYDFDWYLQNGTAFTALNVHDSVLRNAGAGVYRVDIKDKYNNLKQSNLFALLQPPVLDAQVATTPASCYFTPDGAMAAAASGGTGPYAYEWSTGQLTSSVAGVAGGAYVVVVKDANLCLATKQVIVSSPAKINTGVQTTPVACSGSASGSIALAPSGGAGGYTYLWSNGQTAATAASLGAGTYWYRITDANGCYDTDTLTLDNPEVYSINAGQDRKICIGQTIPLQAAVTATAAPVALSWSTPGGTVNGNPINISSAGTYIVTAGNGRGCMKKDTVIVTYENATVNTSFTVSTQAFAGDNTTLVNISPQQQDSAVWILPANSGITPISQSKAYCELRFADTGSYIVGIRAYYSNGCVDEKYKDVHVVNKSAFTNLGNQADAFLKQFTLYPNPTTGDFTLNLLFNSVTVARVRIINVLTNLTITDRALQGAASYSEGFNIGGQPAGTYMVVIETAKGAFVHKVNKL